MSIFGAFLKKKRCGGYELGGNLWKTASGYGLRGFCGSI